MIKHLRYLPPDIIQAILPYTYSPQPSQLCEDIRSYATIRQQLIQHYRDKFGTDDGMDWLCNDICRFLNHDIPTMAGYGDFYLAVHHRLYLTKATSTDGILEVITRLEAATSLKLVNVELGLLRPSERTQLLNFNLGNPVESPVSY